MISYAQDMARLFLHSRQFYFFMTDLEGNFTSVNNLFREKFNLSASEIIGLSAFKTIAAHDIAVCKQAVASCIANPLTPISREIRNSSVDDQSWTEWEFTATRDVQGYVNGIRCIGTDITAKKELENTSAMLQSTVEELNSIVQNAAEAVFKMDENHDLVYVSPEFTNLTGFTSADLIGKKWEHFIHPQETEVWSQAIEEVFTKKHSIKNIRYRFRHKNGKYRWFSTSATFSLNKNDGSFYSLGISQDITERKYAEEALEASEIRYKVFIEQSSEAIWRYELEVPVNVKQSTQAVINHLRKYAFLAECNETMAKMHGLETSAQLVGCRLDDLLNFDDESNIKLLKAFIESNYRLTDTESSIRVGKGETMHLVYNIVGVVEEDYLVRAWGTQRDITQKKATEERIKLLAHLVENTTDVLTSADTEFRVITWNKAAEKIYGLTAAHATGRNLAEFLDLKYENATRDEVRHTIKTNGEWRGEMTFVRTTDGKAVTLLTHFSALKDDQGNLTGYVIGGTDISERKEAELRLQESEERLREQVSKTIIAEKQLQESELFYKNLIGDSLDGILLTDETGKIKFAADSIINILGYEMEELIGKNAVSLVHPDDQAIAGEALGRELVNDPKVKFIVVRLPKKDGSWLWCMVRGHNLLDNPYVKSLVIYFHDDTLRKQAEDELKESELRLRNAHSIAGLAYIEMNANTGKLFYSEELRIVLDMNKEEMPETMPAFLSLIHASDRTKIKNDIELAIYNRAHLQHEFRIQPPNGTEKIIQAFGYVDTSSANVPMLNITLQDVTSIRSAQLALLNSESKFRSLFEFSLDGILLTRAGGTVRAANPAICNMLGYTQEEILQKKRWDIFELNDAMETVIESKDKNGSFTGELYLRHKNGTNILCEVSSVVFLDSEKRSYNSTIVRDITKQKEADRELKRRETVLAGIAEASNKLLLENDLQTAVNYSLELIGKIVQADRVYVYENHIDGSGEELSRQLYEWAGPDIGQQKAQVTGRDLLIKDFGFYFNELQKNNVFTAMFTDLEDETIIRRWKEREIQSILILPVWMQNEFWGFVGFDECHYEREWKNWEIDILKAFSSSLGGAIERNKSAKHLSATNEKLENAINDLNKIMDYSQDVICSFNDQGEFIQVSAASESIWGYKPEEVIGKKFTDFITRNDIENTTDLISLMQGGESVSTNFENRFRRKDGTHVFLEWSAYWYEKERIAFCVARDITLQKEIEKQLVASETRFRAFMNNSPACSWIADEHGTLMYLNKTSLEMLPFEYDDIGKNIFDLFPSAVAASFHQNNLSVLMMNKPAETIETVPFKNGTDGTILVYLFPIHLQDNKGKRIVGGVAIDVTAKTKAEEALRYSERNLKAIFSSTKDAFYLLGRDYSVKAFNNVAAQLYHEYTGTELITGQTLNDVVLEKDREKFIATLDEALAGKNSNYESFSEINGNNYWFEMQALPVVVDNVVEGICFSVSDITSKKLAEEKIKETAEQLTNIMETISDGMFIFNNDLTVKYMNRSAEELLGVKRKTFVGLSKNEVHKLLVNSSDLTGFEFTHIESAMKTGKMVSFVEYNRILGAWFEGEVYPIGVGATLYFRDITDRKRQDMTLALEKSVLEMNALPESALDATVNFFLQGIEKIYRDMICSVVLLRDDKKHIKSLSGPSLPEAYVNAIDGVEIGPTAGSCGTAMHFKESVYVTDIATDPLWSDYKELALEHNLRACWSIPITDSRNEVLATFAIYYNAPRKPVDYEIGAIERAADILRVILENKQAEENIRVTNQRYYFVTKASNEAIWDLDLRTNIMYWAEGYHILFGYDPSIVYSSLDISRSRIHSGDVQRIEKSLQSFLRKKTGTRWEDEYRYMKADGTYAYVLDKAYLIQDMNGHPIRLIGSMQDITSRKELEQKLLEQEVGKQKLLTQATIDGQEKERKEIGKELHDNINQILSTTKLYLDLAQNTADNATSEMIGISSRNIMEAINEIRKLSRSLVPPTLGDLGLIESIKDLCENFTDTKVFNVEFQHRNVKEHLLADNQQLMLFRIIQEQTNNIVKHAKAKNVKINLKTIKDNINLEITDDGVGFDVLKTKKGVGLTNIINRAELFNGHVEILTAPKKGCTIKVKFPIQQSMQKQ